MEEFNLIKWFQEFSFDTWSRLELTRRSKSIKTNEVTITQNLIYNCFLLSRQFDLPIQVYEARNESINGNDIEFAIETEKGYVLLPTQAKIIKSNNKYDTISHKTNGLYQINLLEKYGKQVEGIPLYLFYNSLDVTEDEEKIKLLTNEVELESYGCSIAKLSFLKQFIDNDQWRIPSFWDIHPNNGIPLHRLIELTGKKLSNCKLFEDEDYSIKFYDEEEVIKKFNGINLAPRPKIGYIPSNDKQIEFISELTNERYQPRFRVVISNNPDFNKFQIKFLDTDEPIQIDEEELRKFFGK